MMEQFCRAVTDEQKQYRKNEVKRAVETLFATLPISKISLTSVAKELGWTRSNIYKYYSGIEEILADIWAEKYTALCSEFNDRLVTLSPCTPESYAELAYHMYFVRTDVLKYITLQPILSEDEAAAKVMASVRPLYKRWISEHLDILMDRFKIGRKQAEMIFVDGYYTALGLYNVEKTETKMVPDLADRYTEYMHIRFLTETVITVNLAIRYTNDPSSDPGNQVDTSFLRKFYRTVSKSSR